MITKTKNDIDKFLVDPYYLDKSLARIFSLRELGSTIILITQSLYKDVRKVVTSTKGTSPELATITRATDPNKLSLEVVYSERAFDHGKRGGQTTLVQLGFTHKEYAFDTYALASILRQAAKTYSCPNLPACVAEFLQCRNNMISLTSALFNSLPRDLSARFNLLSIGNLCSVNLNPLLSAAFAIADLVRHKETSMLLSAPSFNFEVREADHCCVKDEFKRVGPGS